MGCKFIFKRVFFVASLCLAGLFGISSVVINEQVKENLVIEKASAVETASSGIEVGGSSPVNNKIYLGVISDWLTYRWSTSLDKAWVKRVGNGDGDAQQIGSSSYARINSPADTIRVGTTDFTLIEVDITASTTNIVLSAQKSPGTYNGYTININPQFKSVGGLANTYLVSSSYDAVVGSNLEQRGFWTYYDRETSLDNTDTLYFSPAYKWGQNYWEWGQCWPYLVCYDSSGQKVYEAAAAGITDNTSFSTRTKDGTGLSHFNWYFINVPKTNVSSMRVYHWERAHYNSKGTYASLDVSSWTSGTCNFFGTTDGGQGTTLSGSYVFGTFFYNNPARAFIRGSFKKYPGISWSMSTGTNPATSSAMGGIILPVEEYSFTQRGENLYRLSLSVDINDSFTYHTYDYLKHKYASGTASSWQYNTFGEYDYDNLSHITVYDERISAETPVADPSLYIGEAAVSQNGNKPIYFKQAGFVELRRTSNAASNDYLQIRYKNKFAMVGSGSFVDKYEWSTAGGVELEDDADNIGKLSNVFLEENDIFQITNNTQWSDWYDFKSGNKTTYFDSTILDKVGSDASFKATIQLQEDGDVWWNNDSITRVIVTCSNSAHDSVTDLTSASGEVKVFNDVTSITIQRVSAADRTTIWNTANINTGRSGSISLGNRNTAYKLYLKIFTWNGGQDYAVFNANTDLNRGDNIRVKKTGYYNLWLNNSFEIYINPITEFEFNDAVYLDFNGKWSLPDDDGALYYTAFFNSSDVMSLTVMNFVNGRGLDTRVITESTVPEIGGSNPVKLLFLRLDPTGYPTNEGDGWRPLLPDGKYHLVWNQSVDYNFNMSYNFLTLGDQNGENKYTLSDTGYITNKQRAEFFGTYFNEQVVCTGEDIDPEHDNWSVVSTEFSHMCPNAQAVARKTTANSSGTQIEKAVSKYDDIVFRRQHTGHNDFMDRNNNDGTSGSVYAGTLGLAKINGSSLLIANDNLASTIIIIVVSSISVLSITALSVLVIKKRKSKEQ